MNKSRLFGSLMLLLTTIIWGTSYSIQTLTANYLGSFTIVFFKGIAGLLLLYFIIKQNKKIDRDAIIKGIIIGIVSFLGCIFQQIGMELSTVSKASFITALYIVFVPIIELITGKKVNKKIWIAILLAILGLYFLCFSGTFSLQIGDILLLLCSIMFAIQIVLIDRYTKTIDGIVLTFISQLTIALFSGIVMVIVEKPSISVLSNALLPILYISVFSGVIATTIQIKYQGSVGASLASLILSLESVFGAIGGWLILNQTLNMREILGCILMFIAIVLAEKLTNQ